MIGSSQGVQTIMSHIIRAFKPQKGLVLCQRKSNLPYCRSFSTHNSSDVKELEIPIPYGKVAAKAWGNEKGYPVLAFHGWLDNCGTFDRLIPLLSDKFYFVTIDAPGHGRSSHQPPGTMYTDMSMIVDFKKVADYLGLDKFHILAHSLGGAFALLFSSIFPDMVNKVILLDMVKPYSSALDLVPDIKVNGLKQLMQIEKKMLKPPPVYTPESAVARLVKGMHNEIDEEGARVLLKRGAKMSDCGKGVVFTRDMRCKPIELISIRSHNTTERFMSALRCELLIILANNTNPYYQPEEPETITRFLDFYSRNMETFVLEHVEGNHFVHLNNPERIAPMINKFLATEISRK